MKRVAIIAAMGLVLVAATAAYAAFTSGDQVTTPDGDGVVKGTAVIVQTTDGKIHIYDEGKVTAKAGTPTPTPTPTPTSTPTPTPSPTPTPPPTGVLFAEDFNGAAGTVPDSAKWTDFGPSCGAYASFAQIQCGDDTVDGSGHLALKATASSGSAIQTRGKFTFKYGTYSAWIKMPSQAGYWPAFWLLNGSQTGTDTNTCEQDVTEVYTQWHGTNSRIHNWAGGSQASEGPNILAGTALDLSAAFHKYSAKWEPGKVTFLLDDQVVGSTSSSQASPWYCDLRSGWMILDLAVGGGGQGSPSGNATMLVDRVEVLAP